MNAHPQIPSRKTLIRFFGTRRPVTISLAAQLVGFPEDWIRERVSQDAAFLPDGKLPWEDVMYWFLHSWPREAILARLKPEADVLLPRGLHLRTVHWRVPAYLVAAIERQAALDAQAARDRHDASVEAYLAGHLHALIEDSTIATFQDDDEFLTAFYYPAEP
jgi:hypothetical protein